MNNKWTTETQNAYSEYLKKAQARATDVMSQVITSA